MKKNNYLLMGFVSSLAFSAPLLSSAQDKPEEGAKTEPAEEVHVHDENCDHGHAGMKKPPTQAEARAFLVESAPFILPEFDKIMKADDDEHTQWLLNDISRFMDEHAQLKAFDPKLGVLFSEVHKLEHGFHVALEEKLEAGEKPEVAANALKDKLKALVDKRLDLRKGQIDLQKAKLDNEHKKIDESKKKIDEITVFELKAIIKEITQVQQEKENSKGDKIEAPKLK